MTKSITVYRVEGRTGQSKAVLRKVMTAKVNNEEEISDTMLKKYEVSDGIRGEVWACNLTKDFLFTTKDYPILYTDVWIEDTSGLMRKKICRLVALFRVTSTPSSEKDLFKKVLKGKFLFEAQINGNKQTFDDTFQTYPGNKEMLVKLLNFTQTPEMKQFLETMGKEELIKMMKSQLENAKISNKPTITYSVKEEVEKELLKESCDKEGDNDSGKEEKSN